ncbi:CD63 antigen [Amyelois transitella]|uniref:CD63 antigen n=1 Tax=Amyelois transitella TaxID=680683 RepID=UPI00067BC3AE|nr:CD63 antigen [Amyelois transitella]
MASAVPNTQKMKFSKSETEYDMKSIRFLLLTITTMFIIIGGLMIVLGISVYSHYHSFNFFYESAKSGRFLTPSVLSVFLGFVLLVVTSFGFFGSLKQSTCMVNLYALILSVILLIKLVVVILAFTIDQDTMMKYIYFPVAEYPTDPEIQVEIDSLQTTLNCCGGDSYLDYIAMEFAANQSTTYISTEIGGSLVVMEVPETCCITVGHVCTRMRTVGCKEALVNVLIQNASVLGVLGVSVMFIMLLGIIFALLLARCIRRLKSERAFFAWKLKEQMILARQEERRKAEIERENDAVYIDHPETSVA